MTGSPSYHRTMFWLWMLLPTLIFLALRWQADLDLQLYSAPFHFWLMLPITIFAAVSATLIGVAGVRQRNLQVICLAMAYASLGVFLMLHGLATPGYMVHEYSIAGITVQLAVTLASLWTWLSALPSDHRFMVWLGRHLAGVLAGWTLFLAAIIALTVVATHPVSEVLYSLEPLSYPMAALTVMLLCSAGYRYWLSFRYARLPLQLSVAHATGWMAVAQVLVVFARQFHLSWWEYHVLLVLATVWMLVGVVRQYTSGASMGLAVRGLWGNNPQERIESGISPAVRALVVATERKDLYTAGHAFRVSLIALRIGEAMGLAPEQLRILAQGGIVHDVGKIRVPDSILNKPGPLTPDERKTIETHPPAGYDMCRYLGFCKEELDIIRHHHERWDGKGYPDGLAGEQIPLYARILCVADIYDALTSDRVYRKGMTVGEARRLMLSMEGQFDPAILAVWERLTRTGEIGKEFPAWTQLGNTAAAVQA